MASEPLRAGHVPDLPWLSRRWLEQYLAEGPPRFARVTDADWDHPNVAVWPAGIRQRLRRLWAGRDRLTAPAVADRAARDRIGPSSYGQDTSATEAARRVTGLVTLIADWADLNHA